jgi:hypothetical protein
MKRGLRSRRGLSDHQKVKNLHIRFGSLAAMTDWMPYLSHERRLPAGSSHSPAIEKPHHGEPIFNVSD